MKITNRILSILMMAVFLASPVMAGEKSTTLNTEQVKRGNIAFGDGDGDGLEPPRPSSAKADGIIAYGNGDGLEPPRPSSAETNGFCILGMCFGV